MREKPADSGDGGKTRDNPVDRERVRAQMRVWQDRVLDLTKSNPLIGLNRSRVSKLRVTAPDASTLFSRVVVEEATLRLPLVRKRSPGTSRDTESLFLDTEPQFVIEPAD